MSEEFAPDLVDCPEIHGLDDERLGIVCEVCNNTGKAPRLVVARMVLEDSMPAHIEVGQCWCGVVTIPPGSTVRYQSSVSRREP